MFEPHFFEDGGNNFQVKINSSSHSYLKDLYLKETPGRGQGVFTLRTFKPNDVILEFIGTLIADAEIDDPCHVIQVGDDLYIGPSGGLDDFVNHSCDPNCGLVQVGNKLFLKAIIPIEAETELTFDYSTSMMDGTWEMDCACSSPVCRGRVKDFIHLAIEFQDRYFRLGVVPEFVQEALVQHSNGQNGISQIGFGQHRANGRKRA